MITFQAIPTEASRVVRARIMDGFQMMVMNSRETDFARIFDAINDMKRVDPKLYQSLRSHYLTKAIFDAINAEDQYRCNRTLAQRNPV